MKTGSAKAGQDTWRHGTKWRQWELNDPFTMNGGTIHLERSIFHQSPGKCVPIFSIYMHTSPKTHRLNPKKVTMFGLGKALPRRPVMLEHLEKLRLWDVQEILAHVRQSPEVIHKQQLFSTESLVSCSKTSKNSAPFLVITTITTIEFHPPRSGTSSYTITRCTWLKVWCSDKKVKDDKMRPTERSSSSSSGTSVVLGRNPRNRFRGIFDRKTCRFFIKNNVEIS